MSKPSADTDEFADIREQVAALCAKFPGEYWRALDRERAYPTDFVTALTKAGYLAALIPEGFGGSGLGLRAVSPRLGPGRFARPAPGPAAGPPLSWGRCPRRAATAPPAPRRCIRGARSC